MSVPSSLCVAWKRDNDERTAHDIQPLFHLFVNSRLTRSNPTEWWLGGADRRCCLKLTLSPEYDFYRLAILSPSGSHILSVQSNGGRVRLPHIPVPRWQRVVQHIQLKARSQWDLEILILSISRERFGGEGLVLAKPFRSAQNIILNTGLRWISFEEAGSGKLSSLELADVQSLMAHRHPEDGPLSSLGWIDEAIEWVCGRLGINPRRHVRAIEQLSASSHTALFRLVLSGGQKYWIKAGTRAEYERTAVLAQYVPEYLPRIIAVQDDWSAWLMEDSGNTAEEMFVQSSKIFQGIGRRIAELQIQSLSITDRLRAAGYSDQGLERMRSGLGRTMALIEDAMSTQDLSDLPSLGARRLNEIEERIAEICSRLGEVGIADGLVHNDLHLGNILVNDGKSVFIDWADAGIGHPFLALEQLRTELIHRSRMSRWLADCTTAYLAAWCPTFPKAALLNAIELISPVAIATQLWNAGLDTSAASNSRQQRHIRSLARQLDSAVRSFEEQKKLLA